MTMTEHFPCPPKYVFHDFLFKSHEEQSNGQSWKRGFCALYYSALETGRVIHAGAEMHALVRESIANPRMDFEKLTDINMDVHDFWMSVFNYPYKRGYPHGYPSTDIQARISLQGHSALDIRKQ